MKDGKLTVLFVYLQVASGEWIYIVPMETKRMISAVTSPFQLALKHPSKGGVSSTYFM